MWCKQCDITIQGKENCLTQCGQHLEELITGKDMNLKKEADKLHKEKLFQKKTHEKRTTLNVTERQEATNHAKEEKKQVTITNYFQKRS